MRLTDCHNVEDFRLLAQARLPWPVFDYIDGAADDELTKNRNTAAFAEVDLVPDVLAGVAEIDTSCTIMGRTSALPLMLSPTALQRIFHWQGESAVARAAIMAVVAIKPVLAPTGDASLLPHLILLGKTVLAAFLLIAIQLWTALRFSNFVPALAIGIGGTFFSVVATSAKQGVYFPWQMPVNMMATEAWRVNTSLGLGCGLGLVALIAMIAHLSRREML